MKILKAILAVIIICFLVSCGKNVEMEDEISNENNHEAIQGYVYDEEEEKYINNEIGIWYIRENNLNIIPSEEYIEEGKLVNEDDFIIENRNNDVWELKEVKEVMVEVRDGFYSLSDPVYDIHYRMDKNWYYEQVKALNELDNIEIVRWHEIFKLPIYTDSRE